MRLLIIAPYYYPYINPRAFRWTAIAEQWANQEGIEVHVVCSKRNEWPNYSMHNGVHIHRVGYNSLKEVFYNFTQTRKRRGEALQKSGELKPKAGWLSKSLLWLNEHLWKPFYWPDDASIWIRSARRKSLQLASQLDFQGIISVSLPFSAHLVALSVHKKYPGLPWIQDIGDPFSLQSLHPLNNTTIYAAKNSRWERYLLKKANKVAVTNPGMVEAYTKFEPALRDRLEVIPPVSSFPSDIKKLNEQNDKDEIHLGYFGSFFKGIREPGPLLHFFETFAKMEDTVGSKLHLHFFGDIFENFLPVFKQYPGLAGKIKLYGLLSREQVFQWMHKMDILVNIGNKSSFQLPSKSADYLASGKPILNFRQIQADTTSDFFKAHPLFLNLSLDPSPDQIKLAKRFIQNQAGKQVDPNWLKGAIQPLQSEQIAKAYLALFQLEQKVAAS